MVSAEPATRTTPRPSKRLVVLAAVSITLVGAGCFISLGEPNARVDGDAGAEGGADASAAPDASDGGTAPRCFGYEPDGALCDSFDDATLSSWWVPDHSAAGPPTLDRSVAFSSPGSLAATVPVGTQIAFSRLVATPAITGFDRFRFRFAVRIDAELAYTELAVLYLEDTPTLLRRLVFFVDSSNTLRLNEFRERTDRALVGGTLGALVKDAWHQVEIEGEADGAVRGSIDGTPLLTQALTVARGRAAEGAALCIGTWMDTRSRARTIYFDDFAFRVDP